MRIEEIIISLEENKNIEIILTEDILDIIIYLLHFIELNKGTIKNDKKHTAIYYIKHRDIIIYDLDLFTSVFKVVLTKPEKECNRDLIKVKINNSKEPISLYNFILLYKTMNTFSKKKDKGSNMDIEYTYFEIEDKNVKLSIYTKQIKDKDVMDRIELEIFEE